jgi:hypothetical protein
LKILASESPDDEVKHEVATESEEAHAVVIIM